LGACNRPLGNHRLAKVSSDGYLIGPWDSTPQKQEQQVAKALRPIKKADIELANEILESIRERNSDFQSELEALWLIAKEPVGVAELGEAAKKASSKATTALIEATNALEKAKAADETAKDKTNKDDATKNQEAQEALKTATEATNRALEAMTKALEARIQINKTKIYINKMNSAIDLKNAPSKEEAKAETEKAKKSTTDIEKFDIAKNANDTKTGAETAKKAADDSLKMTVSAPDSADKAQKVADARKAVEKVTGVADDAKKAVKEATEAKKAIDEATTAKDAAEKATNALQEAKPATEATNNAIEATTKAWKAQIQINKTKILLNNINSFIDPKNAPKFKDAEDKTEEAKKAAEEIEKAATVKKEILEAEKNWVDQKKSLVAGLSRKLKTAIKLLNAPNSDDSLKVELKRSIRSLKSTYRELMLAQETLKHVEKLLDNRTAIAAQSNKIEGLQGPPRPKTDEKKKVIDKEIKLLENRKKSLENKRKELTETSKDDLEEPIDDKGLLDFKETTYTIQLDNAFFKYLQDAGNSSEVLIVLSFEEFGSNDSEIVKVFGPIDLVPDATLSRTISRVTYGPKPLRGAYTRVKIQVIEYDVAEREKRESFLNFVSDLSSSIAIADPTTAAEIKLAAEIGKFVNSLDKNDLILDFHFDLVPPIKGETRPLGIPLDNGQYVLIKQESQSYFFGRIFGTTRRMRASKAWWEEFIFGLGTVPADLVLLPFTIGAQFLADEPDTRSLTDLQYKKDGKRFVYQDDDKILKFDDKRREIFVEGDNADERETYDNKTWIAFSVEMGRDAKLWDAKQEALRTQKLVDKFLKDGDQTSIEGAKTALEGLLTTLKDEKTKKKLKGQSATIQTLIDDIDKKLKADPKPNEEEKAKLEASKGYLEELLKSLNEKSEK
jgi:hypothetical protein